eukprot:TRINITY_DN39545_c0_g1_i1.p1 TRINITY_DN39545_c0_g1~~TRINITY_DN39545_c0_g1_i1.p1  ORF type:complete len:608 (+),score=80.26 TRINITY_DN39545_c0_g1_i1:91-1824(+)
MVGGDDLSANSAKEQVLASAKETARAAANLQRQLLDFLTADLAEKCSDIPGKIDDDVRPIVDEKIVSSDVDLISHVEPRNHHVSSTDTCSNAPSAHDGDDATDGADYMDYVNTVKEEERSTTLKSVVPANRNSRFNWIAQTATTKSSLVKTYDYENRRPSVRRGGVLLAQSLKIGADPGLLSDFGRMSTSNRLKSFVESTLFDVMSAAAITANAIFLGVQTEYKARYRVEEDEFPYLFDAFQYCFAAVFIVELLLRIVAYRSKFFTSGNNLWWNAFDVIVVVSTIVDILLKHISRSNDGSARGVSSVRLLRIIRITRLVRVLKIGRIIRFVRALSELVNSIIGTVKALMWALLLLTLILYAFGIVFTQAAFEGGAPADQEAQLMLYFGSVITSMFTLFKTLTNGVSWHAVVVPLEHVGWAYVAIFTAYVFFAYFAVLNVITSAFCSSAIANSQKDVDAMIHNQLRHNQKFVKMVCELFDAMDKQHKGKISRDAFVDCLGTPEIVAFLSSLELDVQDATMLFDLLDVEKSYSITLDQFVMGCVRLKGTARSVDMAVLLRQNQWLMTTLRKMSKHMDVM